MGFPCVWSIVFPFGFFPFPVHSKTISEILARHVSALGGEEALQAIFAIEMKGVLEFTQAGVEHDLTIQKLRPNSYRREIIFGGVSVVEAFDGNEAWHVMPFDGIARPTPLSDSIEASRVRSEGFLISLLAEAGDTEPALFLRTDVTEGGRRLHGVEAQFRDGYSIHFFLDPETYLVREYFRLERQIPRGGTPNTVTTRVGEYRRVSGVLFPHRFEIVSDDRVTSTMTIERINVNPCGLSTSSFSHRGT